MLKIYTKNYCHYCEKAKNLLTELGINYKEYDITSKPEEIEKLHKISGMMTVPQIFVGEKCLGGYSDIEKMHQAGTLMNEIKKNE